MEIEKSRHTRILPYISLFLSVPVEQYLLHRLMPYFLSFFLCKMLTVQLKYMIQSLLQTIFTVKYKQHMHLHFQRSNNETLSFCSGPPNCHILRTDKET